MISERDVIYITKKQASIAIVVLTIFCILMFMLGYFWGKQCVLDRFGQRIIQESMADQADYESMMQAFVDRNKDNSESFDTFSSITSHDISEVLKDDLTDLPEPLDHDLRSQDSKLDDVVCNTESPKTAEPVREPSQKTNKAKQGTLAKAPKKWSAVLVGFAMKQSALNFVQRLQNRGIEVHIRSRVSKTATGKTKKIWYQIVTSSYDSKKELDDIIAQIVKTERLKSSDIKII